MRTRLRSRAAGLLLLAGLAAAQQQEEPVTFQVTSNLVVLNVTVKERSGRLLAGLKKEDFAVFEDGKPQAISVFEFQQLASDPLPPLEEGRLPAAPAPASGVVRYRDRRLVVLFFDLSGLAPADLIRVQNAARDFIRRKMTPSDLISIMTFSGRLRTAVEFTDDRPRLMNAIRGFGMAEGDSAAGPDEDSTPSEGADGFVVDDTEFNIFNTDRRLSALEQAARNLARRPEKKALVYFSSGAGKTGSENRAQLLSTVNAAVRANVAFYPVDARGLIAGAPAGGASQAAPKGMSSIFSGKAQTLLREKINSQQETLYTLAADTGGTALLDSNDLALGIRQAQEAISSYYILGYYSANPAQDGQFRKVRVEVGSQPRARLDYRPGYYAPKTFGHFTASERERQLEEALELGDPVTDLPLAAELHYFRLTPNRYFVPVALRLPGSRISLARKGSDEAGELEFIGRVTDAGGKAVASVRDTIRVKLGRTAAGGLTRGALQYDTGFTMAPGQYRFKFLVRENHTGRMGTFETGLTVPDLKAGSAVRMSSLVLSSQREALSAAVGSAEKSRKLAELNPLVRDGIKLVPSVTHVFRSAQSLYVYFEVYDAGAEPRIAASLSLLQGERKVMEAEPVRVRQAAPRRRQTTPVLIELPLASLAPGEYVCQVNVVDEQAGNFAFARASLVLRRSP
jgi:VWFA-related protein